MVVKNLVHGYATRVLSSRRLASRRGGPLPQPHRVARADRIMAGGGRCHTAVHPIEVGCCPCRLPPRSRRTAPRPPTLLCGSPSGAAWPYPGGTVQNRAIWLSVPRRRPPSSPAPGTGTKCWPRRPYPYKSGCRRPSPMTPALSGLIKSHHYRKGCLDAISDHCNPAGFIKARLQVDHGIRLSSTPKSSSGQSWEV